MLFYTLATIVISFLGLNQPPVDNCIVLENPDHGLVLRNPPDCGSQNVRLVYELDYEYYQFRSSSITNCQNDVNALFARISPIFERDLNVHLILAGTVIHTSNDSAFTGDGYARISQLRNKWQDPILRNIYNPNCIQLISGTNLGQVAIGIAYLGSVNNLGICIITGQYTNIYDRARLSSHEIAHCLGINHDPTTYTACMDMPLYYIMNPMLTAFGYERFSRCSINEVGTFLPYQSSLVCCGDTNRDGVKTIQDIFDFLNYYFSNSLESDINGDGTISVQDIFEFLNCYFR